MLNWLRGFFSRHVVAEVPEEMSACLNCRVSQCTQERWAACPQRLAEAAALKALRQAQEKLVEKPVSRS
jgi:hypothetical protein